jgi:hypothetical protein
MRIERTTPPLAPVTPLERRLSRKHNLPDHWVRTNHELCGGHR